jgi:hypothetical protein
MVASWISNSASADLAAPMANPAVASAEAAAVNAKYFKLRNAHEWCRKSRPPVKPCLA